ncbi:SixA phosphatase family protein [Marinobacterium mangrovicola]|uniref:Phosphohistidine phosphatase n=1 Tax=Marinobacterium mangrovicola TaxID=1476959 RepID=A0A4R1GC61_9GAMM|nr:histidine phosphatase family protein [Marinobacterium mangrovicola]TCK05837.1 phosphohistidine phosphatase [Marinobacterium mangrovicola]
MKQLTLIRHAKSSWENPQLSDFERPLNPRGQRDLPAMAERVRAKELIPDLLLYSSALRTTLTAQELSSCLLLPASHCKDVPEMYEACWETLLNLLQGQSDSHSRLMLVGHNPGIAELGAYLSGTPLPHFPTSCVQHLILNVLSWSELAESCGTSQWFDYPKLHR